MDKPQLKDHQQIGQEQELFFTNEIAPGAPFWLPKGMIIFRELEKYIRELTLKSGYQETSTPIMIKSQLFVESGHFAKFGEHNMYNLELSDEKDSKPVRYTLKPMNCPESTIIYRFRPKSYRDLPLRLSEIGRLHRKEKSGEVNGLLRVRQITMDDAHIYARPDQVKEEISTILDTMIKFYKSFGFKYDFRLATRPSKNYAGTIKDWENAQEMFKNVLNSKKIKYTIKEGDGAFYGPKIDLHIQAVSKDWQLATVQLDLYQPGAFDLKSVKTTVAVDSSGFNALTFLSIWGSWSASTSACAAALSWASEAILSISSLTHWESAEKPWRYPSMTCFNRS